MTDTPTLTQVLEGAVRAALRRYFVAMPGVVDSYDRSSQLARVTQAISDEEDGEDGAIESPPVTLPNVPVLFPGGATFDLAPGDSVLLVFMSRRTDEWFAGGTRVVARDRRMQHASDVVAIPGLRAKPQRFGAGGVAAGAWVLEQDDIRLGGSASADPVARKSDLQALKQAINSAPTSPNDGGAAFKAALLSDLGSWPVCSAKVKVD